VGKATTRWGLRVPKAASFKGRLGGGTGLGTKIAAAPRKEFRRKKKHSGRNGNWSAFAGRKKNDYGGGVRTDGAKG